jgi:hypothetical protein
MRIRPDRSLEDHNKDLKFEENGLLTGVGQHIKLTLRYLVSISPIIASVSEHPPVEFWTRLFY